MEGAMHYDAKYFEWQRRIGEFGGWANSSKFQRFIQPEDSVLDFGCGGGYLLKALTCQRRSGVEPNESAAAVARANGIEVFNRAADVTTESVDVIISNHALEHTNRPFDELSALADALRPGGKLVFVVPCESARVSYEPGDINQHLYSWSPMSAGNLVTAAGLEVTMAALHRHSWPPLYETIAAITGRGGFDLACRVWARIDRRLSQVQVVAIKPTRQPRRSADVK
jgi:SAM-dependent methyltransferase